VVAAAGAATAGLESWRPAPRWRPGWAAPPGVVERVAAWAAVVVHRLRLF
jgi:hypothetical protein